MSSAKANVVALPYSVSPKIKVLMDECGITGAELARRIDVFPSTVSAWVGGKPVPGAVIAYLELLTKVRSAAR
jgi:transcriptional regulator with XRE-family HTH domain